MRRFLRRWLQLDRPQSAPSPPQDPPGVTRKQFDELTERVDYLAEAVNRLRGRITGALAHQPKPEEAAPSNQDAPQSTIDTQPRGNPRPDRWVALALHQRAQNNGVLPR